MNKSNTRKLTTVAMLIALEIVLTRFLSIETPSVRLGFGFIPIAIIAMLYGPWVAGGSYAVADFLGVILFPKSSAFFIGFTISAFIIGIIYGFFLKNRPITLVKAIICSLLVTIGIHLFLNTYWLTLIIDKGWIGMLPGRLFKSVLMIPLQVFVFMWLDKAPFIKKFSNL